MEASKAEKKEAAAVKAARCLAVRMSPALARKIIRQPLATIPKPAELGDYVIEVGSRMLLREWTGAPTGRADLVTVLAEDAEGLKISRPWNWHQGKIDDDVSEFGLAIVPNLFPKVGYE